MAYGKEKSEHAFQLFNRDIKEKNIGPVLLFFGEEEFLINWACKTLAEKFVDKAFKDIDFVKEDDRDITAGQLVESCDTLSVFSERRVIWAHDFPPLLKKNSRGFGEKELETLKNYIENPNEGAVLIFSAMELDGNSELVKYLKKNCKCYNFERLDMASLVAFASKRFKEAGVSVERETLRYFIEETGYFNREGDYRLLNLVNDIGKLVAHCDGGIVTQKDVDETLKGDLDRFAFNLIDAIGNNRKDVALRLLANVLTSGGEIFSILGLLVNQFELMLEINELSQEGMGYEAMAATLKVNPYRVKKALVVSNKFSNRKLRELLSMLYEIDRNIKTGAMEQNIALELFIGRI